MKPLRAIARGTPSPVSLLSACLNLDYWQRAYDKATDTTDTMLSAPLGGLVDALDRVATAKRKLDSAVLRHRRARREGQGLPWLRLVPND